MDFSISEDRIRKLIRESTDDDFGDAFRRLARELEADLESLADAGDADLFAERARALAAIVERLLGHRLWPGFHLGPMAEEISAGLHDLLDMLLEARELTVISRTGVEWLRQLGSQVRRSEEIRFTLETQYLPWELPADMEEALDLLEPTLSPGTPVRPLAVQGILSRQDLRLTALRIRRTGLEAMIRARLFHAELAGMLGRPECVPETDLALPESLQWHVSGWTAQELIEQLADLAGKAGRLGLFSLAEEVHHTELHPLVRTGLMLLLDGAPWETVEEGLASAVEEDRWRLEEKQNLIDRGVAGILRRDPPEQLRRLLALPPEESEESDRQPAPADGFHPVHRALIERMLVCAEQVRIGGDEALKQAAEGEEDGLLRLALRISGRYGDDRGRFHSRLTRVFERAEEDQDLLAAVAAEGIGLIYEQVGEDLLRRRLAALVPFADGSGESAAGVAALRQEVREEVPSARKDPRGRHRLAELLILKAADPTDTLRALEELAGITAEIESTAALLAPRLPLPVSLRDLKGRLQRAERVLGLFLAQRRELEAEISEWLDGPLDRAAGGSASEDPAS